MQSTTTTTIDIDRTIIATEVYGEDYKAWSGITGRGTQNAQWYQAMIILSAAMLCSVLLDRCVWQCICPSKAQCIYIVIAVKLNTCIQRETR